MLGRGLAPGTQVAPTLGVRLALSAGYLVGVAGLTAMVDSASRVRPMFDPTPGLAFGFLVLVGVRGLPVALAGDLVAHLLRSGPGADAAVPLPWLVPDHVVRMLLVAGCAALLRRRWNEQAPIITLAWFVLTGLLVAPLGAACGSVLVGLLSGHPSSTARWATLVITAAAGTATLAPAVLLPVRALLGAATVPARLTLRVRLETVVQALLLIITPVAVVVAPSVSRDELPSLALALVPLAWVGVRPDLVRSPVVLAASSLALAITVSGGRADDQVLFRAQSLMLTSAMATLFVGATLAANWTTRRDAELAAGRWRALVDLAPVVVARIGPDGLWRADPGGQEGADETVAAARRVVEVQLALEQRRTATVHWHTGRAGRQRHFVTQLTPLADEMLSVTTETTRVQSAEAALAWERTHDRETGLPNRDLLLATAGRTLAEAVPSSLAVLDVGDLSQRAALVGLELTAVLGELTGRVGDALARGADPGDQVLLARIGEDQLGMLLPVPVRAAADQVEQVVAALGSSLAVGSHRLPILTGSGVASMEPDVDPRESLRRAVTAAQAGRESGRGEVVIFDRLSTTSVAERARLAGEVVAAVEGGELEVLFQPDVDLPSGRLSGVEALVRWRRRAGYLAATDLFVQVAEESGAVREVDSWVLEESLAQLGRWRRTGTADGLELGVNVSALSLTRELPVRLKAACDRHGVPPELVRLEVTETALGDEGDAAWVLREVRGQGFRVALDDFGTGYASLSRLHRLPVDLLKLDRSFLHTLTEDTASRALVSLVLGLAEPMRMEVLVEGVETEAQRDLLVELGCRRAQGFLFSRPVPAEMISAMLLDGRLVGGQPAVQPDGGQPDGGQPDGGQPGAGQPGSRPASTASATAAPSAAPATIALDQQTSHAATSSGRPEA
jgi:EAL domain-containing protein (putative c-di-GMP-specific phosphodiesterase class I)/GGDEF domain-containing protein